VLRLRSMGPHGETAGERSEAATRTRQIEDFEYHWDGAFTGTVYAAGKFTTIYTANGQTVTGANITDLRGEARNYYAHMHASRSST
jgi:hypothetical protein